MGASSASAVEDASFRARSLNSIFAQGFVDFYEEENKSVVIDIEKFSGENTRISEAKDGRKIYFSELVVTGSSLTGNNTFLLEEESVVFLRIRSGAPTAPWRTHLVLGREFLGSNSRLTYSLSAGIGVVGSATLFWFERVQKEFFDVEGDFFGEQERGLFDKAEQEYFEVQA